MRIPFPSDYGTRGCALVPIDMSLLAIIAGMIAPLEEERLWDEGDYPQAYRAIADLEASMTQLCVSELVESNNRIYRLLDWSLNGVVYDAGANPPETITPAIPDVPSEDTAFPGLVRTIFNTNQMLNNALNGDINTDFTNPVSIRDQLQSIIDALAASDTDFTEIIEQLEAIALLLA